MEYLASKSVIHADLAARNVLLTTDKVAKISDFGLSKKLYESNNYVKKSRTPLPWRWMALEALTTLTFSTSTDVWAYGVTLFEIFTLGDIPFPNEEWNKEYLTRLASGMRMGRPKYSTQEIYSVIVECWEQEPELRPNFGTLRVFFEQMLCKYSNTTSDRSDNGNGGNVGPICEHSEPLTTTGNSLYVNYDKSEHPPSLGSYVQPSPSPVLNYAKLNHGDQPVNKSQYVNAEDDENHGDQPGGSVSIQMEEAPVRKMRKKEEEAAKGLQSSKPNYANLE